MQTDTNQAVAKLSPLLPLTPEQEHLVHQILKLTNQHLTGPAPAVFTIYGEAGTGKSMVLSHLFNELQVRARNDQTSPLLKTTNYFLVNHPEVLKVYKEIAGDQAALLKKNFMRPT